MVRVPVSASATVFLLRARWGDLRSGCAAGSGGRAEQAQCLADAGTNGNRKMKKVRAFEFDPAPLKISRENQRRGGVAGPRAFEERPAPLKDGPQRSIPARIIGTCAHLRKIVGEFEVFRTSAAIDVPTPIQLLPPSRGKELDSSAFSNSVTCVDTNARRGEGGKGGPLEMRHTDGHFRLEAGKNHVQRCAHLRAIVGEIGIFWTRAKVAWGLRISELKMANCCCWPVGSCSVVSGQKSFRGSGEGDLKWRPAGKEPSAPPYPPLLRGGDIARKFDNFAQVRDILADFERLRNRNFAQVRAHVRRDLRRGEKFGVNGISWR